MKITEKQTRAQLIEVYMSTFEKYKEKCVLCCDKKCQKEQEEKLYNLYNLLYREQESEVNMSKVFFISDTHFGHENIIKYCNRPFKDAAEMDRVMIERWNQNVAEGDYVIHLGDFGFGSTEYLQDLVSKLNGKIVLIQGNHDRFGAAKAERLGFYKFYKGLVKFSTVLEDLGYIPKEDYSEILLAHKPQSNLMPVNELGVNLVFHGHIHNNPLEAAYIPHLNLSVERLGYQPLEFEVG